uniref:Uncharacterized protein n=1 Tax=Cannabis sativa TaxID=3483 RepID=A0A803PYS7_CANSA
MMRAYRARRDDASSSSDKEWLQNFFENEGCNVSATTRVPAEFHALCLRTERRRDYRRMQARKRWAWDADLERERLANERWMEECLREGAPFYPRGFPTCCRWCSKRVAALGLGTYASSRAEPAPPLALCPFAIFPPALAPVEEVKEDPEVTEGSSTQTTAAYYPELEATAQSENFEEVHVSTEDSPSVFCISASPFPQELPRVVSEIIRPPSSFNRRGWLAMRRTFQQREIFLYRGSIYFIFRGFLVIVSLR